MLRITHEHHNPFLIVEFFFLLEIRNEKNLHFQCDEKKKLWLNEIVVWKSNKSGIRREVCSETAKNIDGTDISFERKNPFISSKKKVSNLTL